MSILFAIIFLVVIFKCVSLVLGVCGKLLGAVLSLFGFILSIAVGAIVFGISTAFAATQESLAGLKGLEAAIREKKELQRNLLGYIGTKPARDGLKAQKSEKARRAYREQHESDFIIADTAARYFREHGITKLPASKALQREIEQLTVQKNAGYNDYREKRQRAQELQTVRRNIDQILRGAPSQQKKREQER